MKLKVMLVLGALGPFFFGCHFQKSAQENHPRNWIYREVPSHQGENPKPEFMILVGSSLVFGKNLEANKTMAHAIDQATFHYKAYNRGQADASFTDIVTSFDNRYYMKDIKEESGVVLLLIENSFERSQVANNFSKIKKDFTNPKIRFGVLCEDETKWPDSGCFQIEIKKGELTPESVTKILQRF